MWVGYVRSSTLLVFVAMIFEFQKKNKGNSDIPHYERSCVKMQNFCLIP
jgi:hypothetical protein